MPLPDFRRLVPSRSRAPPLSSKAAGRRDDDQRREPFDPFSVALSAIENASSVPISRDDLPALLRTGIGEPSHVRALFGDVDLHTLRRMANILDIDGATLARAYHAARRTSAAANPELEEFASLFDA